MKACDIIFRDFTPFLLCRKALFTVHLILINTIDKEIYTEYYKHNRLKSN